MAQSPARTLAAGSAATSRSRSAPTRMPAIPWAVLSVISLGGATGALARYALAVEFPPAAAGFPWATFATNVTGCFLIGILMVFVNEIWSGQRLVRPFLGVGVLGGFTTFSTAIVDAQRLVENGAAALALVYLIGTVLSALLAVLVGCAAARWGLVRTSAVVRRRGKPR